MENSCYYNRIGDELKMPVADKPLRTKRPWRGRALRFYAHYYSDAAIENVVKTWPNNLAEVGLTDGI